MQTFKAEHYEINTAKLAPGAKGPVFAVLADLHNHVYGDDNFVLIDAVLAEEPDAVLVAGDLLVGNKKAPYTVALRLMEALRGKGLPVFYENGNHEQRMRLHPEIYGKAYESYSGALKECGVVLLENEKVHFRRCGLDMVIYGYELPEKYYSKLPVKGSPASSLKRTFGVPDEARYNILLAHNPVYFDQYAAWGADLTLSGHLHGGIVRLPWIGGLITPQARLFPKYDAGHFQKDGRDLVVSRGLGTHTVNIRIFNPPELSIVRINGDGDRT